MSDQKATLVVEQLYKQLIYSIYSWWFLCEGKPSNLLRQGMPAASVFLCLPRLCTWKLDYTGREVHQNHLPWPCVGSG